MKNEKIYNDDLWRHSKYPINEIGRDLFAKGDKVSDITGFWLDENKIKNVDLITLGCSFTYGQGVPAGTSWPYWISEKLKTSCANISGPGQSVMWLVSTFFSYVEKVGNPKVVLALFPNFSRMQIQYLKNKMKYKQQGIEKNNHEIVEAIIDLNPYVGKLDFDSKYFKAPLDISEVFPVETTFSISIQFIKMLEIYCRSNNIKLLWSTWSIGEEEWLSQNINNTKFKNYVDMNFRQWHVSKNWEDVLCKDFINDNCNFNYSKESLFNMCQTINCHEYLRDKFGKNFDISNDREELKFFSHWGIHKHVHIYENFLNELEKNENNIRN